MNATGAPVSAPRTPKKLFSSSPSKTVESTVKQTSEDLVKFYR